MAAYNSQNFGYRYKREETTFKVYAKHCDAVLLCLYENANTYRCTTMAMHLMGDSVWELTVQDDLKGKFYLYKLKRGIMEYIVQDPFAYASSVNSKKSAIVDYNENMPEGFSQEKFTPVPMSEAVIYETHVRDMTMDKSLGLQYPGKYLGVVETLQDREYGLRYIKNLGITHLHFLPLQDFLSVDEFSEDQYNWGYDPEHYFVPEGSYATNPEDPLCRITELQMMVKACHDCGLAVVLDVVYNHTYRGGENPLAVLAPMVYYRHHKDGSYSNGSGCGNELKTEDPMTRQLILDSLLHWMDCFHIDGFRFDLMGLMDVETANLIVKTLHEKNPNVLLYGEPWTGAESVLPWQSQMLKGKQRNLPIALFNDDFRNALKGDNDGKGHGLIQGYRAKLHDVKTGILGSIHFNEHHRGFCLEPWETINYLSAHDNLCLYDKLKYSTGWDDPKIKEATKMGFSIILLAFGIPFLQAGSEMMRTKHMDHNSYKSSDAVNAIQWRNIETHASLVNHVRSLITIRKYFGCFEHFNHTQIQKNVVLMKKMPVIAYRILLDQHRYACITLLINYLDHDVATRIKLKKTCHIVYDSMDGRWDPNGLSNSKYINAPRIHMKPYQTLVIASDVLPIESYNF